MLPSFKYKMGPKKSRKNARKIEIPTDTPKEFDLGDTAANIQGRGQREKEEAETLQ